jgi:nicotinamidase/pyrazinamidase
MNTVFFDIDSQLDFMFPAGALYVPGAETIVARIAALNRHAASHGIPLISTMDAHSENDPEFAIYPHHCVAGTLGQRKVASTMVGQMIVEKKKLDPFSNPRLEIILDGLAADRYVVYGVVTEICVRLMAEGLMRFGRPVDVVVDAIRPLSESAGKHWLDQFRAAGGNLITSAAVEAAS